MARPMPSDNAFFQGNGAPMHMECDAPDLCVIGEVPRELNGSFFRNGANPQFAPRGGYHIFEGDGMVHAFNFEDGRVSYKNRWVRTERFELERAAGEALFGSMVDPASAHESVIGVSSNSANTNVVWHGGKLLALWEPGLPTELDPKTLETRGLWDFDGRLTRTMDPEIAAQLGLAATGEEGPGIMTAHPKFDHETGEMLIFGYSATPPYLLFHVVDADGRMIRTETVDVPYPSMMHDFTVTENHVIFPVFPAVFDFEGMARKESMLTWKPELGAFLGVMPRGGSGADVKWFETDPCYVFHTANSHEEGDSIVTEMARFPHVPFFSDGPPLPPTFWRWTIDLAGGGVKQEQIDEMPTEFPRIDERSTGRPYRYSWGPCMTGAGGQMFGFNALARYDVTTGQKQIHETLPNSTIEEPCFVPRSPDAAEGDGFVLVLAYRDDEKRSDLLILDAQNIDSEPLAVVQVPIRIPFGFHGNWRPA